MRRIVSKGKAALESSHVDFWPVILAKQILKRFRAFVETLGGEDGVVMNHCDKGRTSQMLPSVSKYLVSRRHQLLDISACCWSNLLSLLRIPDIDTRRSATRPHNLELRPLCGIFRAYGLTVTVNFGSQPTRHHIFSSWQQHCMFISDEYVNPHALRSA